MFPAKRAGGLKPSREEKLEAPGFSVERASLTRPHYYSDSYSGLLAKRLGKKK